MNSQFAGRLPRKNVPDVIGPCCELFEAERYRRQYFIAHLIVSDMVAANDDNASSSAPVSYTAGSAGFATIK